MERDEKYEKKCACEAQPKSDQIPKKIEKADAKQDVSISVRDFRFKPRSVWR